MFSLLILGLVFSALSVSIWSLAFPSELARLASVLRRHPPRRAVNGRWARIGTSRSGGPRFDRVAVQTGRFRMAAGRARDPWGSRTVAALELAILIAVTGAILAGATFGAGHMIAHMISRVRTG